MHSAEEATYIQSRIGNKVELLKSNRHGKGLFAKTEIEKNTLIHVTHVHRDLVSDPDCNNDWINLLPNHKYNHSKEYRNCKIVTEGLTKGLVTIADIKEGQEILVDYGEDESLEQPEEHWKQ